MRPPQTLKRVKRGVGRMNEKIEPLRGEDGRIKWHVKGVKTPFDTLEEAEEWVELEEEE